MKTPQGTVDSKGDSIEKCPFSKISVKVNNLPIKSLSILSIINHLGMKYLEKFWFFQYFGSIYPGVLAHFSNGTLLDRLLWGQKKSLHEMVMVKKKTAYEYFLESGINEFAKKNEGICTFRIGLTLVIYQTSNVAIVKDEWLDPSTDPSTTLFGNFIGKLHVNSKMRNMKRAAIESVLGNASLIKSLEHEFKANIELLLNKYDNNSVCLENFCREMVADTGSLASGIFDFKIYPLSHYFKEFKGITVDFFELASGFISGLDKNADKKFATICPFIRTLLKDNYLSINAAPERNIIKRYFHIWKIPFTLEEINKLHDDYLRELGTIIVSIYDATSLSLSWAISYIEQNPLIKKLVVDEAQNNIQTERCTYIDLVVLEAIRLGGSNPTVLCRKVSRKFELQIGPNKIIVLPGTLLWLNRRSANQDSKIFSNPTQFDPLNIKNIMKTENENFKSLMSKRRYEINSFNAINTADNLRKCPGRLFSIYIQSLITRIVYSNYLISLKDNSTSLREFSPMPKLSSPGIIQINKIVKEKINN